MLRRIRLFFIFKPFAGASFYSYRESNRQNDSRKIPRRLQCKFMNRNFSFLLLAAFCLVCSTVVFSQNAVVGDVSVRLSLAGGKTVYRAGEPVRLNLTFTASGGAYNLLTNGGKFDSAADEILLSPAEKAFDWAAEYARGSRLMNDHFSYTKLSDQIVNIELALNDTFRFDTPGKYSARIKTSRVVSGDFGGKNRAHVFLTTNEVDFEIKAMSEMEEAQEVKRLSALLDAKPPLSEENKISEQLSFLAGDASTREKVRRYLDAQGRSGNYQQNFFFGLFIARNRALAVKLLEEALRDTNREANFSLLNMLVRLRVLQENKLEAAADSRPGMLLPQEDARSAEIRQGYLKELVESLPKRAGKNLTTTAIAILQNFPRDKTTAPPADVLNKVREILLVKFDEMDILQREYLLSAYWENLRDASLAASLERMLNDKSVPQIYSYHVRTTALRRLLELDEAKARPFVISEIRNPNSYVDVEVLSSLTDEFLPETDAALLEQIRDLAQLKTGHGGNVLLRSKSLLAARYATANIYQPMLEAYKAHEAKWAGNTKGSLLGYFARHNPKEGVALLEQALSNTNGGDPFSLLTDMTRINYPAALDELLRKRLASDDLQTASTAAYLMSKYGGEENRKPIQARLDRWLKEWKSRAAEIDAAADDDKIKHQAYLQMSLIESLTTAKSWKLTETETEKLKQNCASRMCRQRFPVK